MSKSWHVGYLAVIATLLVFHFSSGTDDRSRFQAALIEKTGNYSNVEWLGVPVWQSVLDLWTLQETIYEVKPELLVECGTFKGGSSYFFGQLFDLMGHGRVITVDIQKQHDLAHPRVTYLIGDCAGPEIVRRITEEASRATGPVMVVLDSDHSQAHVERELAAYHEIVTAGSYLHVQDGVIDTLPMFASSRPGPLRAIEAFLPEHPEFEVDEAKSSRFLITHHPKGWLRRR